MVVRSQSTANKIIAYDGPSVIFPKLKPHYVSKSFTSEWEWDFQASSFQVLLVVQNNWEDSDHLSTRWRSEHLGQHLYIRNYGSQQCQFEDNIGIYRYKCSINNPHHSGRIYLNVLDYNYKLGLLSLRYHGPDTHSSNLDLLCQYGGIWIYISEDMNFINPILVFHYCTSSKTPLVLSDHEYYCYGYTVVAAVQYPGISTTTLEYWHSHQPYSVEYFPTFVTPHPIYNINELVVSRSFFKILSMTKVNKLNGTSIEFFKHERFHTTTAWLALVKFLYIGDQADCSCLIDFYTTATKNSEESSCKDPEQYTKHTRVSSVPATSNFQKVGIIDISNVTFQCGACKAGGYIYLEISPLGISDPTIKGMKTVERIYAQKDQCVTFHGTASSDFTGNASFDVIRRKYTIHNPDSLLLNLTIVLRTLSTGERVVRTCYSMIIDDCANDIRQFPVKPGQKLKRITKNPKINIDLTYCFIDYYNHYAGVIISLCHLQGLSHLRTQFPLIESSNVRKRYVSV